MAFQRVPETAEIDTIYVQNGETVQMTFYGRFVGGYSQGDIDALANNCDLGVFNFFLPIQTLDTTYVRTEVRGLDQIVDLQGVANAGAGVGGIAAAGLPNQVTYAVQRNAGLTGRSSRGRVYWIGLPAGDLSPDENFLTSIKATAVVLAIENMRLTINAGGWIPVIVSRFTGGAQRTEGVTFSWVNTLGVDERVDTLRGRLP